MKKIFIYLLFLLPINSHADENIISFLKEGKKVVFLRHAIAPGNGDPVNFDINDCSTQRNLNNKGIIQSRNIGTFLTNNIKIDKVLSSEWCRCKDTAKIAFGKFKTLSALNSFMKLDMPKINLNK